MSSSTVNQLDVNAQCSCGSGRKYKNCCQKKDEREISRMDAPAPIPTLQAGLDHHQAGRLAEAETIYRQILAATPNQADALYLLGILANQTGNHQAACELISQSLAIAPTDAKYLNLGHGLLGLGQFEAAVESYGKALAIKPDFMEAYFALAEAFGRQGQLEQAESVYRQLLSKWPNQHEAHYNLGVLFQNHVQLDSAVQSYRAAVAIKPDFVAAFINMGQALLRLGRLEEAADSNRSALGLVPDFAEVHSNLGLVLRAQGNLDAAAESFRKSIALKPDYADAHNNLGDVYRDQSQFALAVESYGRALVQKPDFAEVHNNLGLALQAQDKFDAALESFRQAIECKPDFPVAFYNMGLLLQKQHKHDEANTCFHRAIALDPKYAQATFSLGDILHGEGKLEEALEYYRKALALKPDYADVHYNMGVVYQSQKKYAEAVICYRQALAANAAYVDAYINLGKVLNDLEQHEEAVACCHQALALKPECIEIYLNLGNALQELDKADDAIACYKKILEIKPDFVEAHNNLGNVYKELGDFDTAVEHYQRAIEIQSDFSEGFSNLGAALQGQDRMEEAIESQQHALFLNPNSVLAHNNLGAAFHSQGKSDAALESYQRARAIDPNDAGVHSNMGNVLQSKGELDAAAKALQQAITINPRYAEAYSNLATVLYSQGKTEEALAHYRHALVLKPDFVNAHCALIFALDMTHDADTAALQQERARWNAAYSVPLATMQKPHANSVDPNRRLRIGYVSGDLRTHSAAVVFGPMLVAFDADQFDVFAYSNSKKEDDHTRLFMSKVTHWRKIIGLSDEAVADLIREDEIDILVDLSGFTAGNRLLVFARKPAPVQVTAWGYATSTGMHAMDAFFADAVIVPPDERRLFVEDVRYLPNVVGSLFPGTFPDVNVLPALSEGCITFGSCNRLCKVSEQAFHVWAQVLLAVPNSRMVIKSGELDGKEPRDRVIGYFTREGIDPARLILLGKSSWDQHLGASHRIDIALDPFPHGGGVTTLESIMMGVPVVTLRWPTIAGRLSASILTTLGLADWIAETPEQYVQLAVQRAAGLENLASLRQQLRGIFQTSVIGDPKAYATAVEAEYRLLWQEWCVRQQVESSALPMLKHRLEAEQEHE